MSTDPAAGDAGEQTIGRRLRSARERSGLSLEQTGGRFFSAGYVAAVERGDLQPSSLALTWLGSQIEVADDYFAQTRSVTPLEPDTVAVDEDLRYQLDCANTLSHQGSFAAAFETIAAAESWAAPYLTLLPARSRYRLPYMRGLIHIMRLEPAAAQAHLEVAVTEAIGDDEAVLRARNLLGASLYQQDRPQHSLEQHLECRTLLQRGKIREPSLELSVYRNLANDYATLEDLASAVSTYREALAVLKDLDAPERKAGVYWGLAWTHKAIGDWPRARLYATQALVIYERSGNRDDVAQVSVNLAEILIDARRYGDAWSLLQRAERHMKKADAAKRTVLYQDYAVIAARRGDPDQAKEYSRQSLEYAAALATETRAAGAMRAVHTIRIRAEALYTAASLAEERGSYAEADNLFAAALAAIAQTSISLMIQKFSRGYARALAVRTERP